MKTLSALEAKQSFGTLMDMAQHEPILITKHGRPVNVMISVEEMQAMTRDKVTPEIVLGVEKGLADSADGRVTRVTNKNRSQIVKNIVSNLDHNQSA